ncbi:hypothetical protein BU17DRAFT_48841 [Hysterangium stoloniferum]|nr:hypothetical protein BU17DRAFT_48841 [Hysterangium stoloniferum]
MAESKPTYIYKIIPVSAAPPDPLPELLPISQLDQVSGFIHLSSAIQVPKTLNLFFPDDERVYILRIPYDRVEKDIRWEDATAAVRGEYGAEGIYAHLYNGLRLGSKEVDLVAVMEREPGGWDLAAERVKAWLVY